VKAELKIETRNIIQNLGKNRYDNVLVILKKKVNFYAKKHKTNSVKMSKE
jgi:hypothetical protein